MPLRCLILILILSVNSYGQEVYTSPLTQHFPSLEIESITRVIEFTPETISISSETPRGKDVQIFKILQKEIRNIDPVGEIVYTCSSLDGKFTTYLILPNVNATEFIDAIQPAQLSQPEKYSRFLLDAPVNSLISQ